MARPNAIQIKMIRDEPPRVPPIESPKNPEEKPEAIASDLILTATGCVVLGYTICRSVDFFFKMSEHIIVNR